MKKNTHKRFACLTIDGMTETDNFHEALAYGMSCIAIAKFLILDTKTGECITRFYSHRRHQLDIQTPPTDDFDWFTVQSVKTIAKGSGVELKFVEHFSDEPHLLKRSEYEGMMDDFDDM